MTPSYQKTRDDDDTSISLAISSLSLPQGKVTSQSKDAHPPPKTPHVSPSIFYRAWGGFEPPQSALTLSRRKYPTVPATSRRGISARFNGDIRYVLIDVSLFRRRVATSGRGCSPQRVDFLRNKSTRGHNALASTASPNAPITLPLALGIAMTMAGGGLGLGFGGNSSRRQPPAAAAAERWRRVRWERKGGHRQQPTNGGDQRCHATTSKWRDATRGIRGRGAG
jgi:hypothetical protein